LGLRDRSASWPVAVLTEYLSERRLLLVMDNCEHLLTATAVLVETLLRGCPGLRVLATSREPLGIPGEVRLPCPSLSLPPPPPPRAPPHTKAHKPRTRAGLGRCPAVRGSGWRGRGGV